jgi:hypothetical protein
LGQKGGVVKMLGCFLGDNRQLVGHVRANWLNDSMTKCSRILKRRAGQKQWS